MICREGGILGQLDGSIVPSKGCDYSGQTYDLE